jgi:hypothetical protein
MKKPEWQDSTIVEKPRDERALFLDESSQEKKSLPPILSRQSSGRKSSEKLIVSKTISPIPSPIVSRNSPAKVIWLSFERNGTKF